MPTFVYLILLVALLLSGCSSPSETPQDGASEEAAAGEVVVPAVEAGSEDELLARFPQVASRNGDVLTITLNNGQTQRFENVNSEDENTVFTYFNGVIRGTPFVLLQHALWEGSAVTLIHLDSGETTTLDAFPNFSPDAQWFFTASLDLVAGYNPNRLTVYRVTPRGATLAWRAESPEMEWGPDDVQWVNATTLTYTKVTSTWNDSGIPDETRTPMTLQLTNGVWTDQ